LKLHAALVVLAAVSVPAWAVNRCVTAQGRVVYTDAPCDAVGARREREVSGGTMSIAPALQAPAPAEEPKGPAPASPKPAAKPFEKAANAPVLTVCYEAKDARDDVTQGDVESAIRAAVAAWNAGCNVNYEYLGVCATDIGRHDRAIDYRVWWATWDNTMRIRERNDALASEHAIAAASPRIGVSLNRTIHSQAFLRQYRSAIVHEFGHVVGVGHSSNRNDVMYSASMNSVPTADDLAACNQAVARRFGAKSAEN